MIRSAQARRVARSCRVIDANPEANRARFECSHCGHQWRDALMPRPKVGRLPSAEVRRLFARYWGDRVTTFCPKCS